MYSEKIAKYNKPVLLDIPEFQYGVMDASTSRAGAEHERRESRPIKASIWNADYECRWSRRSVVLVEKVEDDLAEVIQVPSARMMNIEHIGLKRRKNTGPSEHTWFTRQGLNFINKI